MNHSCGWVYSYIQRIQEPLNNPGGSWFAPVDIPAFIVLIGKGLVASHVGFAEEARRPLAASPSPLPAH